MIIRKPYAFLIKYFQIIHIILFVFMVYLTYKTYVLHNFFFDYAKTGTYTYFSNMAFSYVNILMIIMAIILIALLLLIYLLMKQKEKKVTFYLLAVIFYTISFFSYLFFITVFNRLEISTYNNQSLVFFRDLSMVLYYLNYIFIVVCFVRGFGFNVKKFNFEKDLKELDISDEDREEIEVKGIDYDNVSIYLRNKKRNIGYYFRENSFVLIIASVIIILSLSAYFAFNAYVANKIYKVGEVIKINDLEYVVNNCFVVSKDINNNDYKKGKSYVVIDFNVINNNADIVTLDMSTSRLKVDNKYYYYKSNQSSLFSEFGTLFKLQKIKGNSNNNYILVFEIDNKYNNITLELFESKKENGREVEMFFKNVNIIPYIFKTEDIGNYKYNDKINISKSYYQKGELSIINTEIIDKENYKYEKCLDENHCYSYDKVVTPGINKKILKIEYNLDINKNLFDYLSIESDSIINQSAIKDITPVNYEKNKVLLSVPNTINPDKINLLFNIRGIKFRVSQ